MISFLLGLVFGVVLSKKFPNTFKYLDVELTKHIVNLGAKQ